MDLISVIIPAEIQSALLSEAIASVLGQSEAKKEILAVDDGSTDGSRLMLVRSPAPQSATGEPRTPTMPSFPRLAPGSTRSSEPATGWGWS